MGKRRANDGQAIVEAALVLPLVCLAVVVIIQIIASCHNAVLLQRMAYERSRDLSFGSPPSVMGIVQNPLWGRGAHAVPHRGTQILNPWRPFQTLLAPHVDAPGHLTTIAYKSVLLPTLGFGRVLSILNQEADAEAFLEPPVPGDN